MDVRLGDWIETIDVRNKDGAVKAFYGININKEFMPTVANTENLDPTKYKVLKQGQFLFSGAQTGRDVCIRIGLFRQPESVLVSPSYTIFKIKDENVILPEYLFMLFRRKEMDRYGWFLSDSSIRSNLDWDRFTEIRLSLPPIDIQRKYAAVYQSLLANLHAYERGLDDLKQVCDGYLEQCKRKYPFVALQELLKEVDNRNTANQVTNLQGINIEKVFIPSVANVNNESLAKYKIVKQGQFAYSAMQTGRDKCIRIALYTEKEPCIISPAYSVLEVKNEKVLAEYIMLWFRRSESDRYGWFISDSSIRASLELRDFYQIQIPLPDLSVQQAIVDIYQVWIARRQTAERLKQQISQICPVLVRGAIQDKSAVGF